MLNLFVADRICLDDKLKNILEKTKREVKSLIRKFICLKDF